MCLQQRAGCASPLPALPATGWPRRRVSRVRGGAPGGRARGMAWSSWAASCVRRRRWLQRQCGVRSGRWLSAHGGLRCRLTATALRPTIATARTTIQRCTSTRAWLRATKSCMRRLGDISMRPLPGGRATRTPCSRERPSSTAAWAGRRTGRAQPPTSAAPKVRRRSTRGARERSTPTRTACSKATRCCGQWHAARRSASLTRGSGAEREA
mmetsp:Transcript_13057/g.38385  ORF Transcript_13057/g.38385 Transcript_13057/m.38385 type:complete len:211 (+) Transcript_13057:988-1620(+)